MVSYRVDRYSYSEQSRRDSDSEVQRTRTEALACPIVVQDLSKDTRMPIEEVPARLFGMCIYTYMQCSLKEWMDADTFVFRKRVHCFSLVIASLLFVYFLTPSIKRHV